MKVKPFRTISNYKTNYHYKLSITSNAVGIIMLTNE